MIKERFPREFTKSIDCNAVSGDAERIGRAIDSTQTPHYHRKFTSVLFEHYPDLAGKRIDSILLKPGSVVKAINVLLSMRQYNVNSNNGENNCRRMLRAVKANRESENWELTPLSPMVFAIDTAYSTDSRWTKRDRDKAIANILVHDGITEITNRESAGRIWHIARDYEGSGNYVNHYLVFDPVDYEFAHAFVKYAHRIHAGHNLPLEPNREVKIINAHSSFELDSTLAQQRIYMTPEVRTNAYDDFHFFLDNEQWYSQNRIQYKRGYLFLGPPGNGKTTMIRAMAAIPGIKAFVFDFQHRRNAENDDLVDAFKHVGENAPALFIMEDIDRLFERGEDRCNITKDALLNCLDGLITREGVIVVATANHPELIDDALLKRPGRFDRLVKFETPDYALRREMLSDYFAANPENRVDEGTLDILAEKSAGFSMASVKEIFIASAGLAFQARRHAIEANDALEALEQISGQYSAKEITRSVGFGK